jgi:hypothetical protein
VEVVPAALDRELVEAQLARVEEAEDLHVREARRAELTELLGAVLLHVPRVAGLLRSVGRERQHVRRRDVCRAARAQHRAQVVEDLARVLHVLDRLEEDDRVARRTVGLDEVADEAHSRSRVLQPRVLEGLGVRVDPRDGRGAVGEYRAAVPLAAGHVDHVEATAARRDPAVDDEVAAVPVVLRRDVRKRALAGERQRRDPLGLVLLGRFLEKRQAAREYRVGSMRRVLALSLLAAVLGAAAGPAEARRYAADLPRDGRLKLRVADGEVTASFHVRLRCDSAPFRRRYEDRRLRADLERRRFRIAGASFGDTGDGSGESRLLEIRGRLRRGRVVGRFEYVHSVYGPGTAGDSSCRFGPVRFEAPRRR